MTKLAPVLILFFLGSCTSSMPKQDVESNRIPASTDLYLKPDQLAIVDSGIEPPSDYKLDAPAQDLDSESGILQVRKKWWKIYGAGFCEQAKKFEAEYDTAADPEHIHPKLSVKLFYGDLLPPAVLSALGSDSCHVIDEVVSTIYAANKVLKVNFQRDRPYLRHPELDGGDLKCSHTSLEKAHESFPSFHAAMAEAHAVLLNTLLGGEGPSIENVDPYLKTFQNKFFTRSQEIRESREVLAVHYPSDLEAGRILSEKVMQTLMNQPKDSSFWQDTLACQDVLSPFRK